MSIYTSEPDTRRELAAMELWAAWIGKLMTHAAATANAGIGQRTLAGAAEDAQNLREALAAAGGGWLEPGQTSVLRSIYALWDVNQDRLERIAAAIDPEWYRMWEGRSASARIRCTGTPVRQPSVLAHAG